MTTFSTLRTDFKKILEHNIRIKFYTGSVSNTNWDDNQVLVQSGVDFWTSGLVLPITDINGSNEAILIEQGKLLSSDKRLYIPGDVDISTGADGAIKIGTGSPNFTEHSIIPNGVESWPPIGDIVYKKLYIRVLPLGSLSGEM